MPASGGVGPLAPTPLAAPKEREPPRHRHRTSSHQGAGGARAAPDAQTAACGGATRAEAPQPADGGTEGSCRPGTSNSTRTQEEPDGEPRPARPSLELEAEVDAEVDKLRVFLQDAGAQRSTPSAPRRRTPLSYGVDDEARGLSMQFFRKLDIDGSGCCLGIREMELAREVMMRPTTCQEVVRVIEDTGGPADVNGDGFVDLEDWHRFMCGLHGLLGRRQFLSVLHGWLAKGDEGAPAGRPKSPPVEAPAQQRVLSLKGSTGGGPQTARQSRRGRGGSKGRPARPARDDQQGDDRQGDDEQGATGGGGDDQSAAAAGAFSALAHSGAGRLSQALARSGRRTRSLTSPEADTGGETPQTAARRTRCRTEADAAEVDAAEAGAAGAGAAEAGAAEAPPARRDRRTLTWAAGGGSTQRRAHRLSTNAAAAIASAAAARPRLGTALAVGADDAPEPAQAPAFSARVSVRRQIVVADAVGKLNSGNHGDATAVVSRHGGNHGDAMTAQDTLKEHRDKQPLTTAEELWDMLKNVGGHLSKGIEVSTFVDFFDAVRVLDVSRTLAKIVPCRKGALGYSVDMTKRRMRHLCGLLVQNADLSLLEARMALEGVDENLSEEDVGDEFQANRVEPRMYYKTFRKLLEILQGLMRLDEEFIIALLVWERSGRLELPESLIVQMIMTLRGKGEHNMDVVPCPSDQDDMDRLWSVLHDDVGGAEQEQKRQELNRQLVYRVLTLQDFMVFCRCGNIIDPTSKTCAKSEELKSVYLRVHKHITELLEAHAKKRHRPVPKASARHEHGLVGRNEMEVLLSEVWAMKPFASKYVGPFDLIAQMLQQQMRESFLDRAIKESAERSGGSSTTTTIARNIA